MLTANSTPTQAPLKVLAPGFTVFLISQSTTTPSAINTITVRLAFSAPISGAAGAAAIVVSGLLGVQTASTGTDLTTVTYKPSTRKLKTENRNRNPKPQTPSPKPQTQNLKPQTINHKPKIQTQADPPAAVDDGGAPPRLRHASRRG